MTTIADHILFLDGEAIVLDKPAGLPVDPPRDGGPSVTGMLGDLRMGFQRLPVPVHRIDRDTSGCLLLARNPGAVKRFAQAFEGRQVAKRYLAVLEGVPEAESGTIDQPIAKVSSREQGWRMVPDPSGKSARTAWTRLAVSGGRSLVAFVPETGRTHQLRVHAASVLGCPIVGDPVYGRAGNAPMLLHAQSLSMPRAGKSDVAAEAPWPARFTEAGFPPAE